MWKDYSKSYLRNNRASGVTIMAAAFIATLFLSLICCLGYNFWIYEIEKITLGEGAWQGRIAGKINEKDLAAIQSFSNVEAAVINEKLSGEEQVIDLYFQNKRTIYHDMPLIAQHLGLGEDAIEYHSLLLSRYFIHDPADEQPPLLLALYLAILIMVSFSLVLIIRGSFEISMNRRVHQFGIFSSIGATPWQIRSCLIQEAAALCILPILIGSLSGVAISFGAIKAINLFAADVAERHEAVFSYHSGVFAVTILVSVLTVLFSAWIPARKLSEMTPLQAIHSNGSIQLKKAKHSPILSFLFGIEGELSGNALKAQKKALRIANISLLLSFLGFSIMLMFTTLSGISTRYTYFERYQDAWDVMLTVKDTQITEFELTGELQELTGAESAAVYQKAEGVTVLPENAQSDELLASGGWGVMAGQPVSEGQLQIAVPIVILDDNSFLEYCAQIGAEPGLYGAVILNRIWNSQSSNFRYKEYIPFIRENRTDTVIQGNAQSEQSVEIPVLAYTEETPALREEYGNYSLVHFLPLSVWKEIAGQFENVEKDSHIRIISSGDASLEDLNTLEGDVAHVVSHQYEVESENRVQEKNANDSMITGMQMILGAFCVLLGIIGIANVFSNTLGFLRQRKREFAEYMSVGLTPVQMKKMFVIEGFVIAGKPLFITLVLTVVFVQFAVRASYLDAMVFWAEAPIIPIVLFALAIAGFVALAYYIGGKRILQCDLNETLRNDTMI